MLWIKFIIWKSVIWNHLFNNDHTLLSSKQVSYPGKLIGPKIKDCSQFVPCACCYWFFIQLPKLLMSSWIVNLKFPHICWLICRACQKRVLSCMSQHPDCMEQGIETIWWNHKVDSTTHHARKALRYLQESPHAWKAHQARRYMKWNLKLLIHLPTSNWGKFCKNDILANESEGCWFCCSIS